MTGLSLVLPCYNEEKNMPDMLKRLSEAVKGQDMEVVLVNNGSVDGTEAVMREEIRKNGYGFARIVKVEKNIGYGYGVMTGLRGCHGEYLAFSHADLQCDPADVVRGFRLLLGSKDPKNTLVKGKRVGRNSVVSTIFLALASVVLFQRFKDINAQPKVFHRNLLEKLKDPPNDFTLDLYVQYIALRNKMEVKEMPVRFAERKHGQSNWSSSLKSRMKTMLGFTAYLFKLRFSGE